jgi:hypothetical protein
MTAQPRLFIPLASAAMAFFAANAVIASDDFPGAEPDRDVLKTQQKVDWLFEKGDYDRAIFIYREELAPLGDKYAQYMLGYMHLTGKGVPKDAIAASAWYRLAAERGEPHFVQARDKLWKLLNEQHRAQSDLKYIELRKYYSDATLVSNLVASDLAVFGEQSKRIGLTDGLVGAADYQSTKARVTQNSELIEQIEVRMNYLDQMLDSGKVYGTTEIERIEDLQQQAAALIAPYESPD